LDQRLISLFEENGSFAAVACWMRTCKAMQFVNWDKIRDPRGYMHNNFSIWRVQAWPTNMFIYDIASIQLATTLRGHTKQFRVANTYLHLTYARKATHFVRLGQTS